MSGARAWYETREKFVGDRAMLDRAARIDWDMRHGINGEPRACLSNSYMFPRVDYGRVTWTNRYELISEFAVSYTDESQDGSGSEGYIIPACNTALPDLPHDIIPPHMTFIEYSCLTDPVDGYEDFGGGECETSVYFVQGAFSGLIKIGIATDVSSRVSSIRTSCGEPILLLQHVTANKTFEKFLHGLFEPLKHHGEWFYPHWSLYSTMAGLTC